jgi:hypothetical protein
MLVRHVLRYILLGVFLFITLREAMVINLYHPEMDFYIPNYFSNKSWFEIIFSPINEFDLTNTQFRGRELGSAINFLDLHLMFLLLKLVGFFFSPVSILMGGGVLVMLYSIYIRLYPDGKYPIALSLFCLAFSAPVIFLGMQYRTNKVACVFFFISVIFIFLHKHIINKYWYIALITICSLSACLCDEQGIVLILTAVCVAVLELHIRSVNLIDKVDVFSLLAGLAMYFLYKHYIGVYLFYLASGVSPVAPAVSNYLIFDKYLLSSSLALFARYVSFVYPLVGHLLLAYAAVALIKINFFSLNGQAQQLRVVASISLLASVVFIAAIYLMGSAHKGIFFKDIVSYYSFPIAIVMYMVNTLMFLYIYNTYKSARVILLLIMACSLFYNIYKIPYWERLIAGGHLKNFLKSDLVVQSIYSDEKKSQDTILSISVEGASPGYNAIYPYGAPGVAALRFYLSKGN